MSPLQIRHAFLSFGCILLGAGLLMVYSASITARPSEFDRIYLTRQITFLCLALFSGCAAAAMPARIWKPAAPWLFAATVLLLGLVLVPGIGHRVNGAQRWIRYGGVSMQPSELAKLTLPLFVCWWMDRTRHAAGEASRRVRRLHEFRVVVPIAAVAVLVMMEPDLGTAAFLAGTAGLALFLSGWPIFNFVAASALLVPALAGMTILRPYQVERITGYLAAWRDFDAAPYQVRQSLMTLGSGGLNGVGLGRGWQKLSFLPEANTDFVFAVVGEELGLIGTLGVLGLWAGIYLLGARLLSAKGTRTFEYAAGLSILTQLVAQAGLNMAVVTALVPPKGIAHPLVSYGGSSLVVSVTAIGMIVSLSKPRAPGETVELQP